jgi:DNA primase
VYDNGRRWICFGGCGGGDVADFVQRLYGVDLKGAVGILGGGSVPTVKVKPIPANDTGPAERTDEALALWRSAVPVEGTVAADYLRCRGITIDPPLSLRYAELSHGRGGPTLPCLVCCVSSPEGPLWGVQRIFLAPDGRGKADVPAPKLSLGRVSGGAIRLAPLDGHRVVVCEGPETGLSIAQLLKLPVWVAAGASMLPNMRFPASIEAVAIGGDNDEPGRIAANKAARAFTDRGLKVRQFFPPPGTDDFNDYLQKGGL